MKIGRLITTDGIEYSLESSQLKELKDYLARQAVNESLASGQADGGSVLDPEEYERAVQAAHLVQSGWAGASPIAF